MSTIGIKLRLEGDAQAVNGLRRVQAGVEDLGESSSQVGELVGRLGAALATVASVGQFIRVADAVTTLNNQLRLATGSSEAAATAYQRLFDVAQRSRVGFVELGSTFASITRATESLGLSQDQLLTVTEAIGNAVTISGASAQAAQAALVQLGQGLASGALRGEELNSVLEQTPRLARALADGLGVSIGQLRELGSTGQLTADAVITALQSQSAVLAREVESSVLTVGQAFTQLSNSTTALVGEIDRSSGATAALASTVQDLSRAIDDVARAFRGAETASAPVLALDGIFRTVFETISVLGVNVAFVLRGIGNEIGGIAAQAAAVARLDFNQARTIGQLMREDAAQARREVDALSERILRSRELSARAREEEARTREINARADARLRRQGAEGDSSVGRILNGRPTNPGGSRASARDPNAITAADILRADVAGIRRALDEYTSAYAASETILEARRSAGLVSERDYFAAKRLLLEQNTQAQISALQQERARLESEQTTGRERLQQTERIRAIDQEMAALRTRTSAQIETLGIQEQTQLRRVAQAYLDAEAAARSYLASLDAQYTRDLAGVGRGRRARELSAGMNQIDDRFEGQRQDLAGELRRGDITQEQYERQLALINEYNGRAISAYQSYYDRLTDQQTNWLNGANEALANYADSTQNVAGFLEQSFTQALSGLEDVFTEFVTTGKLSFTDLANSVVADITRIIIRAQVMEPIAAALQGSVNGGFLGDFFGSLFGGARANGGPVSPGRLYEVNERGPELLSIGNRSFLMMGASGGRVTPNERLGGRSTSINVNVSMPQNSSRATGLQFGRDIAKQLAMANARNG